MYGVRAPRDIPVLSLSLFLWAVGGPTNRLFMTRIGSNDVDRCRDSCAHHDSRAHGTCCCTCTPAPTKYCPSCFECCPWLFGVWPPEAAVAPSVRRSSEAIGADWLSRTTPRASRYAGPPRGESIVGSRTSSSGMPTHERAWAIDVADHGGIDVNPCQASVLLLNSCAMIRSHD